MLDFITPNWPAPNNVHAYSTTRIGGHSQIPFANFNLALNVGENSAIVMHNRSLLKSKLQIPSEPIWLQQVHGVRAIQADLPIVDNRADAAYTQQKNVVCTVMTADCLPLLVCDNKGTIVAAIHAGWRGLAAGIIENTIKNLPILPTNLLVWLGPAISAAAFEVGDEVYQQFINWDTQAKLAFKRDNNEKWLADLYLLAKQRLKQLNITQIFGGNFCTYSDSTRFYSYRRDKQTGRMASLIWLS